MNFSKLSYTDLSFAELQEYANEINTWLEDNIGNRGENENWQKNSDYLLDIMIELAANGDDVVLENLSDLLDGMEACLTASNAKKVQKFFKDAYFYDYVDDSEITARIEAMEAKENA